MTAKMAMAMGFVRVMLKLECGVSPEDSLNATIMRERTLDASAVRHVLSSPIAACLVILVLFMWTNRKKSK